MDYYIVASSKVDRTLRDGMNKFEGGGVRIYREDILAHLHEGEWVRTVGLVEEGGQLPMVNSCVLGPRRKIDRGLVFELVTMGADLHVEDDSIMLSPQGDPRRFSWIPCLLRLGEFDRQYWLLDSLRRADLRLIAIWVSHGAEITNEILFNNIDHPLFQELVAYAQMSKALYASLIDTARRRKIFPVAHFLENAMRRFIKVTEGD